MTKEVELKVKQTFETYKGLILDVCEMKFGESREWPSLRSHLLKLLSNERGLEFKITEIINNDIIHSRKKMTEIKK